MNVYVRELASALARAGVACRRLHPGRRPRAAADRRRRARPPRPPHRRRSRPRRSTRRDLPDVIDEFADGVLDRLANGHPADAIHANYWLSGVAGHTIKHELDLPLVSTFHTLDRVKAEDSDDARPTAPRPRPRSSAAPTPSSPRATSRPRSSSTSTTPTPPASRSSPPASTTPSSPPATAARPAARSGSPSDGRLLLFVGRIQPLKGLDVAVRALAALDHTRRAASSSSAGRAAARARPSCAGPRPGRRPSASATGCASSRRSPTNCSRPTTAPPTSCWCRAARSPSASSRWKPPRAARRSSRPRSADSPRSSTTAAPASSSRAATPTCSPRTRATILADDGFAAALGDAATRRGPPLHLVGRRRPPPPALRRSHGARSGRLPVDPATPDELAALGDTHRHVGRARARDQPDAARRRPRPGDAPVVRAPQGRGEDHHHGLVHAPPTHPALRDLLHARARGERRRVLRVPPPRQPRAVRACASPSAPKTRSTSWARCRSVPSTTTNSTASSARLRVLGAVLPARDVDRLRVGFQAAIAPCSVHATRRYGARRARGADRFHSFGEVRMTPGGSSGSSISPPPFALIVMITLTGIMANTLVTPAIPDIRDAFGVGSSAAGLLLAAATAPGIVLAPVLGSARRPLRPARGARALPRAVRPSPAASSAFAPSFNVLLALRFAQGIGSAGLINLAVTIIGDHWEGAERTRYIGRNAAALTASIFVLPPLGGLLTSLGGWRLTFAPYWIALLTAALIAVTAAAHDRVRRHVPRTAPRGASLRPSPTVLASMAMAFLLFVLIFGLVLTVMPLYLADRFGVGAAGRGLMLAVPAVASTAAALNVGRIRSRLGTRRAARRLLRAPSASASRSSALVPVASPCSSPRSCSTAPARASPSRRSRTPSPARRPMRNRASSWPSSSASPAAGQTVGPVARRRSASTRSAPARTFAFAAVGHRPRSCSARHGGGARPGAGGCGRRGPVGTVDTRSQGRGPASLACRQLSRPHRLLAFVAVVLTLVLVAPTPRRRGAARLEVEAAPSSTPSRASDRELTSAVGSLNEQVDAQIARVQAAKRSAARRRGALRRRRPPS